MRSLLAFFKKESLAQLRSVKFYILGGLFILFGLMNPLIAKSTPWLLEVMSDSLAQAGMNITVTEVTVLDSWVQFFKNIPMALIIFVILESNIFTGEYRCGTLILTLTKGLDRYKVVIAKAVMLILLWTVGFFLCFGITYGCNALFWDNAKAQNLLLSATCWWVFGLWVVMLLVLFSAIFSSNIGVLGCVAATVAVAYVPSLLPKTARYSPVLLMNGSALNYGVAVPKDFGWALGITVGLTVLCFAASIPLFNKKQL
jgi:ABC-2 type transport system permease protein